MRLPAFLFAIVTGTTASWSAPPQVVADLPVTGSLVQQVLGDKGEVTVLMDQGADPHHYQLRPSDARRLQASDLLIWVGPQLTPWLARASANLGARQALSLLAVEGTHLRHFDASDSEVAEPHDHAHDDPSSDTDNPGVDPHAWLDPANAQLWLATIADRLARQDPENAEFYRANATAAIGRMAEMDRDLTARLQPVSQRPFVVFHDAYGYFTDHFGLMPAIAVTLGDASAPSAAHLSQVRERIREAGVTCAFPEYGTDPALIAQAIEGTDARLGGELSPSGRGLTQGPGLYHQLMTDLATTLIDCLD